MTVHPSAWLERYHQMNMLFGEQSLEGHARRSPYLRGPREGGRTCPCRPLRSAHLKWYYWITARPLLVSRTSSPMTVMFSSRPTTRLMLPGIAPQPDKHDPHRRNLRPRDARRARRIDLRSSRSLCLYVRPRCRGLPRPISPCARPAADPEATRPYRDLCPPAPPSRASRVQEDSSP